jgi:hypothetical protein
MTITPAGSVTLAAASQLGWLESEIGSAFPKRPRVAGEIER